MKCLKYAMPESGFTDSNLVSNQASVVNGSGVFARACKVRHNCAHAARAAANSTRSASVKSLGAALPRLVGQKLKGKLPHLSR